MKKMIATLVVCGTFALCTIGCGGNPTTGTTTVTADKTKVETPKDSSVKVDKKDNAGKPDVKVDTKEKDSGK